MVACTKEVSALDSGGSKLGSLSDEIAVLSLLVER
jgi:hypothetical protein